MLSIASKYTNNQNGFYIAPLSRIQTERNLDNVFSLSRTYYVNAEQGLDYTNIFSILTIRETEEISIGHAIIAHAAFVVLFEAVKEMARIVKKI
ncbi:MAG: hypothetical protein FJ218_10410 [Ignavibacteria bacterium]|nr:hypothetical protein [Ignavibacteria bacterium]